MDRHRIEQLVGENHSANLTVQLRQVLRKTGKVTGEDVRTVLDVVRGATSQGAIEMSNLVPLSRAQGLRVSGGQPASCAWHCGHRPTLLFAAGKAGRPTLSRLCKRCLSTVEANARTQDYATLMFPDRARRYASASLLFRRTSTKFLKLSRFLARHTSILRR